MNKQKKDGNISWTDWTWNPVKRLCPVGCFYCYARAMYKRFKLPPEIRWDGRISILSNKKPSKIFVCSTIEIFHPSVKAEWRNRIFKIIELNPQHTFQILTKMPENIDRPMPDNVWLGISVTNPPTYHRKINNLRAIKAKIKFMSIEPLLSLLQVLDGVGKTKFRSFIDIPGWLDWVIVGRLTGYGKKRDPKKYWIESIVRKCEEANIPIFLKNNLKEIWDEKLIQEFPDANL